MEEDIKILEDVVKNAYEDIELKYDKPSEIIVGEEVQAIENLINRVKELEEELTSVKEIYYTQKEIETDFIPKSKIREKIEEYDKQRSKMEKADNCVGFTLGNEWSDLKAKIQVLQEILEDK